MKLHPQKPWLKKNGTPLRTDQLQKVSQHWNPAMWEKYLKTLEVPLREELWDGSLEMQECFEKQTQSVFSDPNVASLPKREEPQDYRPQVRRLVSRLRHKVQRKVMRLLLKGLSLRDAAQSLGMDHRSVQYHRNQAIQSIQAMKGNALKGISWRHWGIGKRALRDKNLDYEHIGDLFSSKALP